MATIAALTEDFESASNGTAATTANTIFDNIATGDGAAVFTTTNPFQGTRSLRITSTAGNATLRADITSTNSLWIAAALRYNAYPSVTGSYIQFATGSAVSATLRANTTGSLTFRDGTTNRWTSSGLALNTWYEVHVQVTPGTSGRVKIYNADGSLLVDSGSLTLATTGAVDNVRFGSLASNAATDTQWDRIRGDTTTEPATLNTPATPPDPEEWSYTPPSGWSPMDLIVRT